MWSGVSAHVTRDYSPVKLIIREFTSWKIFTVVVQRSWEPRWPLCCIVERFLVDWETSVAWSLSAKALLACLLGLLHQLNVNLSRSGLQVNLMAESTCIQKDRQSFSCLWLLPVCIAMAFCLLFLGICVLWLKHPENIQIMLTELLLCRINVLVSKELSLYEFCFVPSFWINILFRHVSFNC